MSSVLQAIPRLTKRQGLLVVKKAQASLMPQAVLLMVRTGNMKSEGITEAVTISMRSGVGNPAITATNNKFVLKLKYSITHFTMRKKTTTKSKQQVKAAEPKMTMPCRITIRLTEEQMKLVANNAKTEGTQAVGLLPSGHPWTKGQRPQSRHSQLPSDAHQPGQQP